MSKVAFFSNYINHHQLPFCKQMVSLTNNNFNFVSQKAISLKRIPLGYKDISNDYDFVVKTYESNDELNKAYALANDADYVIFGATDDDYFKQRLKENKITFEYSERLNKKKKSLYMKLKTYVSFLIHRRQYRNNKLFLLCSGGYVANDFKMFSTYVNKTYKWGYFPEFIEHDIDKLLKDKNSNKVKMLWAGRLIDWKHPELLIELAKELRKDNLSFEINIIGTGVLEDEIKQSIKDNGLSDCVVMLGSMHPEEVRKQMDLADIFITTSDIGEGWGVVVNEAMNSGCAVVASHAVGSVTFLIKHKQNGLIYKNGDFDSLVKNVKVLFVEEYRKNIAKKAYETIKEEWNAEIAAKRFLKLAECLDQGKETPFESGPCSKAIPIKDDDMYNYLVKK